MKVSRCAAAALAAVFVVGAVRPLPAAAEQTLLNVSYDPTRELYAAIGKAFAERWKAQSGETLVVRTSNGGSGAPARAVIRGPWAAGGTPGPASGHHASAQR